MKFSRILIATDFSETSFAAIKIAQTTSDAEIILLHVNSLSSAYLFGAEELGTPLIIEEQSKISQKLAEEKMEDLKQTYFKSGIIKTKIITSFKNPSEEICAYAEKESCDLIIIGSRGHTALGAFFIGSTAQRVQLLTKCPLLVVPPNS